MTGQAWALRKNQATHPTDRVMRGGMLDRSNPMSPAATDPQSRQIQPDRLVCTCNRVFESTIQSAAVALAGDADRVIQATRAATSCGCCRPEVLALCQRLRQSP